jgi:hypothetical protein
MIQARRARRVQNIIRTHKFLINGYMNSPPRRQLAAHASYGRRVRVNAHRGKFPASNGRLLTATRQSVFECGRHDISRVSVGFRSLLSKCVTRSKTRSHGSFRGHLDSAVRTHSVRKPKKNSSEREQKRRDRERARRDAARQKASERRQQPARQCVPKDSDCDQRDFVCRRERL